jgi:hypothetical protein
MLFLTGRKNYLALINYFCFTSLNISISLLCLEEFLLDMVNSFKAHSCKETLPYSRHQFNLTFVICIKDPERDQVKYCFNIYFLIHHSTDKIILYTNNFWSFYNSTFTPIHEFIKFNTLLHINSNKKGYKNSLCIQITFNNPL